MFIKSAVIGNASIGAAKLTDWLESDAKGPSGVPVLRLNFRTGEIQINSAQVGGWRMAMNNNGMRLYDENDTLRVSLGR
ncbi:phage tail tip fiber protein [Isoalcanivorax beigongshangi]|uniref:Tip attachment protein J central straight fiber domain-containing protein n=1 Tax=Isoalcanivorax beigongshangi TaxID=3238810 RepID=A0ABV4AFF5_9GAMM